MNRHAPKGPTLADDLEPAAPAQVERLTELADLGTVSAIGAPGDFDEPTEEMLPPRPLPGAAE